MSRYGFNGPPRCDYVTDPGQPGVLPAYCWCNVTWRDVMPAGETDEEYAKRVYADRCERHMDLASLARFDAACEAACKESV